MTDVSPANEKYTIQQVAAMTGLSIPTLRYYEEIGLIPPVERNASSGHRMYSVDTTQLVESLANLRAVGLSIEEMREYLKLREQGDSAATEKRTLFKQHADEISGQIKKLKIREQYLAFKVAYWDARARNALDEAEQIAGQYTKIVKKLR